MYAAAKKKTTRFRSSGRITDICIYGVYYPLDILSSVFSHGIAVEYSAIFNGSYSTGYVIDLIRCMASRMERFTCSNFQLMLKHARRLQLLPFKR